MAGGVKAWSAPKHAARGSDALPPGLGSLRPETTEAWVAPDHCTGLTIPVRAPGRPIGMPAVLGRGRGPHGCLGPRNLELEEDSVSRETPTVGLDSRIALSLASHWLSASPRSVSSQPGVAYPSAAARALRWKIQSSQAGLASPFEAVPPPLGQGVQSSTRPCPASPAPGFAGRRDRSLEQVGRVRGLEVSAPKIRASPRMGSDACNSARHTHTASGDEAIAQPQP